MEKNMPRPKKLEGEPVEVEIIEEEPKEELKIEDAVLLENMLDLRFLDQEGKILALREVPGKRGVYWLVPINKE
jgi:hypothetical protein